MFSLTLDRPTKSWMSQYYESGNKVILEYGTGGSTLLALESSPKNIVYACETDSTWLAKLMLYASENKLQSRLFPVHIDIGQTGDWGVPVFDGSVFSGKRMQSFLNATIFPWRLLKSHEVNPDFVFIDGRWRKACFLSALLYCQSPMLVLWDDYADRPQYHVFDEIILPVEMIGRSALYEVRPKSYDALEVIDKYLSVFGDWG
jgi:protein O-GlcNAc transferase